MEKGIGYKEYKVRISGLTLPVTSESLSFAVKFYTLRTPYDRPQVEVSGTVDVLGGQAENTILVKATYANINSLPDGMLYGRVSIIQPDGKQTDIEENLNYEVRHGL